MSAVSPRRLTWSSSTAATSSAVSSGHASSRMHGHDRRAGNRALEFRLSLQRVDVFRRGRTQGLRRRQPVG
ncbi:hypothetical protein [Mesorhizobium sp. IMUNJ 23232]|uniref:hypothetical protein n=1 Tax=Mesorhizobium sp. IMUNJ 23232 TaxID=3376064 RepID=UPI003788392F